MRAGAGRLGGGGGPLGGGGGPLGGGGGPLGGGGGPHGTNDDFWLPKVRYFAVQLYNVDLTWHAGFRSNWPAGQERGSTAVPQCGEKRGLTKSGLVSVWMGGTYMQKTCDVAEMAILAKKIGGKSA